MYVQYIATNLHSYWCVAVSLVYKGITQKDILYYKNSGKSSVDTYNEEKWIQMYEALNRHF